MNNSFSYNGGNINYSIQGQGDPIVFIHGFGLDSSMWEEQVEELSKNHQVITYDMRGFGESSVPNGKYSHQEDLHELLKSLNILKPTIVGHSFGGEIAVDYALRYPKEVEKLVLLSPSLSGMQGDNSEWEKLSKLAKIDSKEASERMFMNPIFDKLRDNESVINVLKYSAWHFKNEDPREYSNANKILSKLSCPVEVVIGENDLPIQKEIAKRFETELGVETRIIPNCGHMAVLEEPGIINEIIENSYEKEQNSEIVHI